MPVGLGNDADAKSLGFEQASDNGHTEAGVIDISVAGDEVARSKPDPMPYLRSGAPGDISAMRGGCRPEKFPAGCEPMWNFLFLRATAEDEQRARVIAYIKASIDKVRSY